MPPCRSTGSFEKGPEEHGNHQMHASEFIVVLNWSDSMSGKRIGYTGQGTVRSPELRWRVDRRRTTDPGEEKRRDLQVGPDGGHSCCTKESDKYPPHRETDESNPAERKSRDTARPRRQRGADHEFRTSPARSKSSRSVRTGYSHVRRFACRFGKQAPLCALAQFQFFHRARGKAPAPSCLQKFRSLQASIVFCIAT
jgi:hypothetical protein